MSTIHNPFVRLERCPRVELAIKTLIDSSRPRCFLCRGVVSNCKKKPEPESESVAKIGIFKNLLIELSVGNDYYYGDESCEQCLSIILQVSTLQDEMVVIRKRINIILSTYLENIASKGEDEGRRIENEETITITNEMDFNNDEHLSRPAGEEEESANEEEIGIKLEQVDCSDLELEDDDKHLHDPIVTQVPRFQDNVTTKDEEDKMVKDEVSLEILIGGPKPKPSSKVITKDLIFTPSSAPSNRCETCSTTFIHSAALNFHTKQIHQKEKLVVNHICPACGDGHYDRRALILHMKDAHSKQEHFCSSCLALFTTEKAWALHEVFVCKIAWSRAKLNRYEIKVHRCTFPGCEKIYKYQSNLCIHKRKHRTTIRVLPGSREGGSVGNPNAGNPVQTVTPVQVQPIISGRDIRVKGRSCTFPGCNLRFAFPRDLRIHSENVHGVVNICRNSINPQF